MLDRAAARLRAMKVAVIGASRGVGRHIAEQALARGYEVTAAVRNPAAVDLRHERLRSVECDALDTAAVSAAINGQDVVFCALGDDSRGPTTLYSSAAQNVLAGMRQHGVRRLVFLSNFGVLSETGQRRDRLAHAAAGSACDPSHIGRPSPGAGRAQQQRRRVDRCSPDGVEQRSADRQLPRRSCRTASQWTHHRTRRRRRLHAEPGARRPVSASGASHRVLIGAGRKRKGKLSDAAK